MISEFCTPAFLFCIISIIYSIISSLKNFNVTSIFNQIIIIMVWSLVLNFLCSSGLSVVAWALVLLPFFAIY